MLVDDDVDVEAGDGSYVLQTIEQLGERTPADSLVGCADRELECHLGRGSIGRKRVRVLAAFIGFP